MSIVVNDMNLAAKKLGELVGLAGEAESEFEKAAIFAAVTVIVTEFENKEEELDSYLLENLERVRWHTSAALGYDIDNGHDKSQHLSWARGAVGTLRGLISDLQG